jgi:hypothetical protein
VHNEIGGDATHESSSRKVSFASGPHVQKGVHLPDPEAVMLHMGALMPSTSDVSPGAGRHVQERFFSLTNMLPLANLSETRHSGDITDTMIRLGLQELSSILEKQPESTPPVGPPRGDAESDIFAKVDIHVEAERTNLCLGK